MPLLTWIGDVFALSGGLLATIVSTDMTPRAYLLGAEPHITVATFLNGMIKTPFLGLISGSSPASRVSPRAAEQRPSGRAPPAPS